MLAMTDRELRHPLLQLHPLVLIAAVTGLFFAVNPQIIADWMIYSFDDGTYSHAYLIPFMSGYIAYTAWQREQLTARWSWPLFCGDLTSLPMAGFRSPTLSVESSRSGLLHARAPDDTPVQPLCTRPRRVSLVYHTGLGAHQ